MNKPAKPGERPALVPACISAARSFAGTLPVLLGVILLMGLFQNFVSTETLQTLFTGSIAGDTLSGALLGSVSTGNAIASYIIGAALLNRGISLFAVFAFLITWVTVGLAQLPAEAAILGKKFAFIRNGLSFFFALAIAVATTLTWMALS